MLHKGSASDKHIGGQYAQLIDLWCREEGYFSLFPIPLLEYRAED